MRILIVDDDYTSRTQLKSLLSAYGDCDAAPNGATALLMLRDAFDNQLPYSLVTMDLEMPEMRGPEVLSFIRAFEAKREVPVRAQTKVVMVTVKNNLKDVEESYQQECSGYLVKPATPQNIKKVLAEIGLAL